MTDPASPFRPDPSQPALYRAAAAGGMGALPSVLYHYTTALGFSEIIRTRRLWASDLRFMNDANELRQGRIRIREALDRRLVDAADARKRIFEGMRSIVDQLPIDPFFAVSFSADPDNLGQWRAYGGGGGFAIGFPTADTSNTFQSICHHSGFYYTEVAYNRARQDEIAEMFVDEVADRFEHVPIDSHVTPEIGAELAGLVGAIAMVGAQIKHESFREEREWRMLSRKFSPEQFKVRARKTSLVPYVEIALDERMILDLRVVVGPCPLPELAVAAAAIAIQQDPAARPRVCRSDIPFRDW